MTETHETQPFAMATERKMRPLSLPNLLTYGRIAAIPAIVVRIPLESILLRDGGSRFSTQRIPAASTPT